MADAPADAPAADTPMEDSAAPAASDAAPSTDAPAADAAGMDVDIFGDAGADDDLGEEIARAGADEIAQRTRMLENEIKVLRNENSRLLHEQQTQKEKIKENAEKIKLNKQLPYLVANVVELLDMDPEVVSPISPHISPYLPC